MNIKIFFNEQYITEDIVNQKLTEYHLTRNDSFSVYFTHNNFIIGKNSFKNCKNLVDIINLDKCIEINESAFENCKSIEILFLTNVKKINKNICKNCIKLKHVRLNPFNLFIDDNAFENCLSLSDVWYLDCAKYIGNKSFFNCQSLNKIYLPWCSYIGISAFENCKNLMFDYQFLINNKISKNAFNGTKAQKSKKYKYSILCYIINNYELIHEIEDIEDDIEYILVTDNKNLKSNTWKIIYLDDNKFNTMSVFEKCYYIRFNLFDFCSSDICVYFDACITLKKSITEYVLTFMNDYDLCLLIHPDRDNIIDELNIWEKYRGYNHEQSKNIIKFSKQINYDFSIKGLIECTFRIEKNTKSNQIINQIVFYFLKYIGINNDIDRLDQCIYTIIINKFYDISKILPLNEQIIYSNYLQHCYHKTYKCDKDWYYNNINNLNIIKYLNNNLVKTQLFI